MRKRFAVLDLGNTLTWQHRLRSLPHEWLDIATRTGSKFYAAPETLAALEAALARVRTPLLFWGAGDYHYVTYARLRALRFPLTVVLFDHHSDCASDEAGIVTCGNWVRHALKLPWVACVLWIGAPEHQPLPHERHPRLVWIPLRRPPANAAAWLRSVLPTFDVYLSVDKDVLTPEAAATNWDHGTLTLADLLAWIACFREHARVIGADIGGEWVLPPGHPFPTRDDLHAIRRNEAANLALLDALLAPHPRSFPRWPKQKPTGRRPPVGFAASGTARSHPA
ncbi:arginase family protein [Calditerricola yamamurae]